MPHFASAVASAGAAIGDTWTNTSTGTLKYWNGTAWDFVAGSPDSVIYAGGATLQKVRKILKTDLSTVLDSADYSGTIYALAQDTLYIYAGGGTLNKVRKILKSDMSTVSDSADYGGTIRALQRQE